MKYINRVTLLFVALTASSLNAQLILEDFERYIDTSALHEYVFSFGTAAQAGKPLLEAGRGENDSHAARFSLTWKTGNNANLSFINLSSNARNLSGYSEITSFVYIEACTDTETSLDQGVTAVKLSIEGMNGSIWQTRSVTAEKPPVQSSYTLRFRLSPSDMERIEGTAEFREVVSNIKNIRLRFENARRAGFCQNAYIDSITAIQ